MSDSLTDLAKSIRFDNASKGFDPTEGGVERYYLLVISEICEAQNELRDGHHIPEIYWGDMIQDEYPFHAGASLVRFPENKKPEGFSVEIADAIIRILDIQAKMEWPIEVFNGSYQFDPNSTLDRELLGVVESIAMCFRQDVEPSFRLNLALSALFQICENLDINIMNVISLKLAYNRTRPPKHGRKF